MGPAAILLQQYGEKDGTTCHLERPRADMCVGMAVKNYCQRGSLMPLFLCHYRFSFVQKPALQAVRSTVSHPHLICWGIRAHQATSLLESSAILKMAKICRSIGLHKVVIPRPRGCSCEIRMLFQDSSLCSMLSSSPELRESGKRNDKLLRQERPRWPIGSSSFQGLFKYIFFFKNHKIMASAPSWENWGLFGQI